MDARFDIVALGEAMVEFNQAGDGGGRSYLQGFGGDTSNAVIAAARQGARCAYVTRLGDDDFGRMCLDLWRAENGLPQMAGWKHSGGTDHVGAQQSGARSPFVRLTEKAIAMAYRQSWLRATDLTDLWPHHIEGIKFDDFERLSSACCDEARGQRW
jgi:2-dehydro-3-deoxygluconokinase